MIIIKYLTTAAIIVAVSEIAKRSDKLGALISSLPLVTIMVMVWLFIDKVPSKKIADHAYYTFWFVLPTMPMFLLLPYMMNKGQSFPVALGASVVLTFILFVITAVIMKRFGVDLMP